MTTHQLDIEPNLHPDFYVNEPDLIDSNILFHDANKTKDSVLIYVPLELSSDTIMHRLLRIKEKYSFIDYCNEFFCSNEVDKVIDQLGIYDQIWSLRGKCNCGHNGHSLPGTALAKNILEFLKNWDSIEEFPYTLIDELRQEYQI